jgi:adenylate cyclase
MVLPKHATGAQKSRFAEGSPLKQPVFRYLVGSLVLAALLAHTAGFLRIGLVSRLDAITYDAKLRLTMPQGTDERVVIIDIDEKSLFEVGRWPWSRDRVAELVDRLFSRQGVTLLGIDVIFAEADKSSGIDTLEDLARGPLQSNTAYREALATLRPKLDYDNRLAQTIAQHPVVLGFNFASGSSRRNVGQLPAAVFAADALRGHRAALPAWDGYSGNRPEFQRAALGAGYNNGLPDFDGVSRRVPLLAMYQDQVYEALSLAVARAVMGNPKVAPAFGSTGDTLDALKLDIGRGSVRIPIDQHGAALIPFRGEQGSFRYYSAADVLADRVPPDALRGKIALLGTSAAGLLDLRVTPVAETYPGIEVHANLVSGILDGRLKSQPEYILGAEFTLLAVFGTVAVFWLPRLSPLLAVFGPLLMAVVAVGFGAVLWQQASVDFPLGATVALTLGIGAINAFFGYFTESHAKRRLARLFGQYVPPELVKEMSRNPERYGMEGRNAELAVLFADIRGFTAISQGLAPQELARLMNEYFTAMTEVIREYRGTLDKYVGDAIMAFWGAPMDDPAHARHAVDAALALQRKLVQVNSEFERREWPKLAIGIGINTGVMTVGDMGSRERKAYTVLGDAVNLGARLERLTAYYGVGIILGETTQRRLTDMACRELDRVLVRGRSGAVAIYEPIGRESELGELVHGELALWGEALTQYRKQDWDSAEATLRRLAAAHPQRRLYSLYLERIALFHSAPPPTSWDAVWRFDTR